MGNFPKAAVRQEMVKTSQGMTALRTKRTFRFSVIKCHLKADSFGRARYLRSEDSLTPFQ